MYRFCSELYLGSTVKNIGYIKLKLRMNRHLPDVFLVMLCSGRDQLEIINAEVLRQKYYRKRKNKVVGVAHLYPEAVEIVRCITEECVKATGEADLKSYLSGRFDKKENK